MRKVLIVAVFAVAFLGMLAPPVFAQAPAPKVTITGLFDQVLSGGQNFYDGNYSRNGDREWYARTRFRPDFVFEVGRTKAVLGLELDADYGQTSTCGAGPGKAPFSCTGMHFGSTASAGLNTDVAGIVEIKWMYTEFDLTGKDSLMPFIPVLTVARAGLQAFGTLASYKVTYANGDFAGFSAVSTFAPNIKTNVTFVVVEDEIAGTGGLPQNRGAGAGARVTRGKDNAWILSADITPFQGLDVKPLYSYFRADGTTSGSARRTATDRFVGGGASNAVLNGGGGSTTAAAATYTGGGAVLGGGLYLNGDPFLHENRHTFGVDARWRSGPWGFDPTVYYQVGNRHVQAAIAQSGGGAFVVGNQETFMNSWLLDGIGSWQSGPFLVEVRGIYSTGNKATDNLSKRISYFEPLDMDSSYYAGWANILALGIDYFNGGGPTNNNMGTAIGYDRYGRIQLGLRGTYNYTPALAFYGVLSPTWTAQKVDTHTGQGVGTGTRTIIDDASFAAKSDSEQSRYIGTEADLGMTWKFAPNTAFDLVGAWLFAGKALDTFEIPVVGAPAVRRKAEDAWTIASRVRFSF